MSLRRFHRMLCTPSMLWIFLIYILVSVSCSDNGGDERNDIIFSYAYCSTIKDEIVHWVSLGNLSRARLLTLDGVTQMPECKKNFIEAYKVSSDRLLSGAGTDYEKFQQVMPDLAESNTKNSSPKMTTHRLSARQDSPNCIPYVIGSLGDPTEEWDRCCSILPTKPKNDRLSLSSSLEKQEASSFRESICTLENTCCEFFPPSQAHLRLPALHEPALRVRIPLASRIMEEESDEDKHGGKKSTVTLDLEQDGYLRPFDVSSILWPSGYLLTQCLADPISCQIPEVHKALIHRDLDGPVAIELGTGVGSASIAFALHLKAYLNLGETTNHQMKSPLVLSTDVAPQALALTLANAHWNDANDVVAVHKMNHSNFDSISQMQAKYPKGFEIVVGSSLQAMFHETDKSDSIIWKVLDRLLNPQNKDALVVFVHTKTGDRLHPPDDGRFILVRRVGGDFFSMYTRAGDQSSDFEISVFRRNGDTAVNSEL